MRKILILITVLFSLYLPCSYAEDDQRCIFMSQLKEILKTDPVESAKLFKYTGPQRFLGVSNGRVPSRPGFSTDQELSCVMYKHDFTYINAGYDIISCKGQRDIGKRMEEYASKYNQEMKSLLSSMGLYQCAI